jgi:hypothetical protein
MKNFRIEIPKELKVKSIVNVYIDNELFVHVVRQNSYSKKYYMSCINRNDVIFVRLEINKLHFMNHLFGIEPKGVWPEVDTLDKLKHQLEYLKYYEEF